jgi:serine/threonine-protein kinase
VAAVHQASGQRVAIKYLSPSLFRDQGFLDGFRAEAGLLRSLDVPHVVRLFDYIEAPGEGAAIVMELIDGVSLHELITRRGATSPEAALVVLKGSLLGLAAAHDLGIVHRDYKPENVLVDGEGNSKLSDFGVAVKEGKKVPSAGTPLYMAPEQWDGMAPSPATDIYAAAAVFFECLTGKTPFSGRLLQLQAQHAAAPVPVDLVDEPLRELIARGMAKSPAARPRDAMAFVAELESTAAAAYGLDWEARGRSQLRERAAALLLLLLGAGAVGAGAGGAVVGSWLAAHKVAAIITTAAVTAAIVVAGTLTGLALTSGNTTVAISQAGNGGTPTKPAATSPAAAGGATGPATATFDAAVTASPPVATSACATPTTFTYSANLTATAPGTVSYRWVYSAGKSGPVQQATFAAPGTQQVSGGSVAAKTASTGWAAIQLVSPGAVLSNKATYRLVCTMPPAGIGLSAFASPASQSVACGSAPPAVTFTGLVSSPKAGPVTYHWALDNGAASPPQTVTFPAAGTAAVQPLTVTAPADTASGSAMLVVTSPVTETSAAAGYSVSCTTTQGTPPVTGTSPPPGHAAVTLTAAAHVSPGTDAIACGTAAPAFAFSGSITASRATTVTYYWKLPSGNSAPRTLAFTRAGTLAVAPASYTPAGDTASGSGTIVITSPAAVASPAASFTLTCTQADVTVSVSGSPASPASVACGVTPPAFTLTGTVQSDHATSGVAYRWTRPDGTAGRSGTIALAAGSPATVTDQFTPPSDTFSGSETLTISGPFSVTESLPVAVSCTFPALAISGGDDGGNLPGATVGTPYAGARVSATGGEAPYAWSASGLPAGLAMSAAGDIAGTPAQGSQGTHMVTVMVADSQAPAQAKSQVYTLVVSPRQPVVSIVALGSNPLSPITGICGQVPREFDLDATVTSTLPTSATVQWVRSDGSASEQDTIDVAPGQTTTVVDELIPASDSWQGSDTLEVITPNETSRSISLSFSCTSPPAVPRIRVAQPPARPAATPATTPASTAPPSAVTPPRAPATPSPAAPSSSAPAITGTIPATPGTAPS